VTKKTNKKDLF